MRLKISLNRMNSIVTDMTSKAKVCRICLLGNIKGVISLFTVYNGSDRIYSKVMEVANIQISVQDGLPTWICYSCLVHLETSYQFKMQAEKSDQLLRKQLEITNTEETEKFVDDGENPLQEQTEIQGHFMSEVTEGDGSEIQDGIKITNVVSQAQPELLDVDECPSENRLADLSDNDARYIPTPACICTEGQDDAQRNACLKMSSDRASDEDVNNCINNKTCQVEETAVDDLFMSSKSKSSVELIQSGSNETSKQTQSLAAVSGVGNNSPNGTVRTINVLLITRIDNVTKAEPSKDLGNSLGKVTAPKVANRKPSSTPQRRSYDCPNCKQEFTTRKVLNSHILSAHKGVRGYKCHICGRSYSLQDYLSTHLTYHEKDRMFKCNDCGESFTRKCHLTSHNRLKHNASGPAMCEHCGKYFKTGSVLYSHQYKHHSKENASSVCYICGKSFLNNVYLTNHLITHDNQNLTCDICKKTYRHKRALKSHKYTVHSDINKRHICKICDKQFKYAVSLRKHVLLKHEGTEKPKCHICNTTFSQKVALQTHMKIIHIGLTPHACKYCKQEFRWKQTCSKHENKCLEKIKVVTAGSEPQPE